MFFRYSLAFLKHGSIWAYRIATWAVLALGLGFAAAVIALRYLLLPGIDAYREPIAKAVSAAVGQPVSIGRIEGSWRGYRPELRLFDVQVREPGGAVALGLERVDTVLSWVSLLAGRVTFHRLEISEAMLEMRRDSLGELWLAGDPIETAGEGRPGFRAWLARQRQIVVRDARIVWIDEMRSVPPLVIEQASLRIDNEDDRHRFALVGTPPAELASAVVLRGEFASADLGDVAALTGRIYAEFEYANLALASIWIALPLQVDSGLGALRLWLDFDAGQLESATADTNLVNVRARLRPQLEALQLQRLSGHLGWRRQPGELRLTGRQLNFETAAAGAHPPFGFEFHWPRAQSTGRAELRLSGVEPARFAPMLGALPIGDALREQLLTARPEGRIAQARVSWDRGASPWRPQRLDASFEDLSARPLGRFPGVRNISGSIASDAAGGRLSITSERGELELPAVFVQPLPLDFLSAEAEWSTEGERLTVMVRSLSFTNPHAAGNIAGGYTRSGDGPGTVDLRGTLVRAEAADAWQYLPNSAPNTREWLKRALTAGRLSEAKFTLSGPLDRFPFRDGRSGRFEVVGQLEGASLDYADGWPALAGVAGELAFRGDQMHLQARAGRIFDLDIAGTDVRIAELGRRREVLRIEGQAAGATSGFLRFVADSPVSRYIGGLTQRMQADGSGRLALTLELPLREAQAARVTGRFQASGGRLSIDPRVPDLSGYSADLAFTERTLTVRPSQARFLGGPLRIQGGSSRDGGVGLEFSGALDTAALARALPHPGWRGITGTADWRGRLTLSDGTVRFEADSALTQMASALPAPLDKVPGVALPLRLAWS